MKKKTKLIGYIIGVILFISTIAGFTYAMYRKSLYNVNISGELKNINEYVIYSKGTNISSGALNPVSSYTNGSSATITFYKNSNTPYDIYGHVYLDINTMTIPLSHELKYTIVDNSTSNIVGQGSFYTYTSGDSLLVAYNIPLNTTATTYTVYVWVDEDLYDSSTASSTFNIDVRCYATMKTIDYVNAAVPSIHNAANYIKYMYDSRQKSTVTANNITYNLASSVELMNDRHASMDTDINGGGVRYYGANPNNYVWLGDTYTSTYTFASNGSSIKRNVGDKKLWRIIGVFDGRIKLISNDIVGGNISWDTSVSTVNNGLGINQWGPSTYSDTGNPYEGADLMRLLNPGYESTGVNNSLYWTKGTGTVYTGENNATTSNVSFANTGLANVEKNMIDTATWYLGAISNRDLYVNEIYAQERQSSILGDECTLTSSNCNDTVVRTSIWNGKVGLIYPSDYGYSADLTTCGAKTLPYYGSSCKTWLFNSSYLTMVVSPFASSSANTPYISTNGGLYAGSASSTVPPIRPAVYLKSNVTITAGSGTETDPYVLSLQ